MKIALLPNIVGFPAASMDRYAESLAAALPTVAPKDWEFTSLRVEPVARFGNSWGSRIGRFVSYPSRIRQTKADIYHVLDHSHANLARATPPEKSVITVHDCIPLLAALGKLDMPVGRFTKVTFPRRLADANRCARVIADSEMTKQHLMEYGKIPAEKIAVIYLAVGPTFAPTPPSQNQTRAEERTALLKKFQLPDDSLILAHVGTPGRYKNVPGLLKTLKLLTEDPTIGSRVRLIRGGAPFEADDMALMDLLGLTERVTFAGRLPDDAALATLYRAADVFLFPSLWEGFGWPPLEAMACGTPPVVSNGGSLPEVVGDVTPTAAPDDAPGLAAICHRLLTDPAEHAAAADRAIRRAAGFTWEHCARQVCDVYQSVLG